MIFRRGNLEVASASSPHTENSFFLGLSPLSRTPWEMLIYNLDGDDTDSEFASGNEVGSCSRAATAELFEHGDDEPPRKPPKHVITAPERMQWSDEDSTNDGEAVYKKFKARKSEARKNAVKSGKRARAIEAVNGAASSRVQDGTGVGKRAKRKSKGKAKEKTHSDVSSDDDLMEWTVPDYLKERRAKFDERTEHLRQGGLRLPPAYDDLYFSDDEHLEHLKERPDFPLLNPCAPYADIPLPYSLGLIPAPIAQWLRDYQIKGAEFLHEAFVYQKGVILGKVLLTSSYRPISLEYPGHVP